MLLRLDGRGEMIVFDDRSFRVHKDISFAAEHGNGIFRSHPALFRDRVLYRGDKGLIGFVFEQHVIDCCEQATSNGNPGFLDRKSTRLNSSHL